jgi:hypothetical protein
MAVPVNGKMEFENTRLKITKFAGCVFKKFALKK